MCKDPSSAIDWVFAVDWDGCFCQLGLIKYVCPKLSAECLSVLLK